MSEVKRVGDKKIVALKLTPEQRQQERRQRFLRLAAPRVSRALVVLRNVGRLSNRASYSFTEDEAKKICGAIMDAAVAVGDAFAQKVNDKPSFTL